MGIIHAQLEALMTTFKVIYQLQKKVLVLKIEGQLQRVGRKCSYLQISILLYFDIYWSAVNREGKVVL